MAKKNSINKILVNIKDELLIERGSKKVKNIAGANTIICVLVS